MGRIFDKLSSLDRRGRMKVLALTVAAAICCGVLLAVIIQITSTQAERSAAANEYEGLRQEIGPAAQQPDSTATSETQPPRNPKEINADYVGWLAVPGAGVDYPIVQGADNTKYLNTTFEGESNSTGAIFMDYRNTDGLASPHVVIYGHNMKDGTMFAGLSGYLDAGHMAASPTITITTADDDTLTYTIFAARVTDAWDAAYRLDFADSADFGAFAAGLGAPEGAAQMLTLSTCTNSEDDTERILVHAARVA